MDDRLPLYLARLPKRALVRQWIVAVGNVAIAAAFTAGTLATLVKRDGGAAILGPLAVFMWCLCGLVLWELIKVSSRALPAATIEVTATGYRVSTPFLETRRNSRELARGATVRIHRLSTGADHWRGGIDFYTLWTDGAVARFSGWGPLTKDSMKSLERLIESRGGTLEVAATRPSSRNGAGQGLATLQRLTPAPGSPASALVTLVARDITLAPLGGDGEAKPGWPKRLRDEDASDHFLSVEAATGSTVSFVATFEEPSYMERAASEDFQGWTRLVSLLDDGTGTPLHIATEVAVRGAAFYKDAAGTKLVLHLHAVE